MASDLYLLDIETSAPSCGCDPSKWGLTARKREESASGGQDRLRRFLSSLHEQVGACTKRFG
jgi:hypothetical protein